MGTQIETVKDSEGNKHLIFDESCLYDDSQIGENLSDFEILKILSEEEEEEEEKSCFNAKVRSLNNNKIYAVKKIKFDNLNDPQKKQNCKDITEKLKELNNPHILKYYKSFEDDKDNLYVIMEYMNNSDINGYIKAHQILNEDIKEEEIWNILLQCISALDYLHQKNLGIYGIKFNSILMNNEQNAKIDVFIDQLKEESQNYDNKYDIQKLGKFFNIMIFSQHPNIKNGNMPFNQINIIKEQNDNYSKELNEIIKTMLNDNPPTSSQLYKFIKQEYVKKYAKDSSINAVLRCLYSYKKLNTHLFNREQEFENNKEKFYINYWYTKAIRAFSGKGESNLKECFNEFRRAIAFENSKLDGNKEIDPLFLTAFLLEKMHKELNVINKNNSMNQDNTGKYVINSIVDREEEDRTNKDQMLSKFLNYYHTNINSIIAESFFGILKTKRNCQTCKTGNYYFSNFCFVFFDLSSNYSNKEFNILIDGFNYQHNYGKPLEPDQPDRVLCERCLSYQKHLEFNRYYTMNHQLIICFIRGNKFSNESQIHYPEYLDLSNYIDEINGNSPSKYYLVGCIYRTKNNKFSYFSRDPDEMNSWHIDQKIENLQHQPNINQKDDQIIMLFYNNINYMNKKS